ncbi:MAG: hypothetical protein MI861_23620 [Pirellulales bacterium]|nr:hypothetical protein [Pirellulales bacterium]
MIQTREHDTILGTAGADPQVATAERITNYGYDILGRMDTRTTTAGSTASVTTDRIGTEHFLSR